MCKTQCLAAPVLVGLVFVFGCSGGNAPQTGGGNAPQNDSSGAKRSAKSAPAAPAAPAKKDPVAEFKSAMLNPLEKIVSQHKIRVFYGQSKNRADDFNCQKFTLGDPRFDITKTDSLVRPYKATLIIPVDAKTLWRKTSRNLPLSQAASDSELNWGTFGSSDELLSAYRSNPIWEDDTTKTWDKETYVFNWNDSEQIWEAGKRWNSKEPLSQFLFLKTITHSYYTEIDK